MSKFQTCLVTAIVTFCITVAFMVILTTSNIEQEKQFSCTEGKFTERITTVEPTDDPNITQEVDYYLLQCDNGESFRVKTGKNFPINTKVKLGWVRQ